MQRRRVIIILSAVLFVGVVAVVFLIGSRESEPRYNGKGIREWAVEVDYGTAEQSEQARAAIKHLGPATVPYLIRMLEKEDSPFGIWLRRVTGNALWFDGQASYSHAIAATALRELGPEAQSAVPALEKVARQRDHLASYKARAALIAIRDQSVEHLAKTLEDRTRPNWSNWVVAATVASELGDRARPLIPLLIQALDDTNSRIRFQATSALGGIAREPDLCVPAILRGLKDPEQIVRHESFSVLHRFPGATARAQTEIQRCLADTNDITRAMAVVALKLAISSLDSNWVTQAVQPLLNDSDETVRDIAANLLKELRNRGREESR